MSHEIDETYAFYCENIVKARKQHTCDTEPCGITIEIGHKYVRVSWHFDGETEDIARCLRCQRIHEHLRALDRGFRWPAERLDCGESYEDAWGGEPPEEIARLAFVTAEEMQGTG